MLMTYFYVKVLTGLRIRLNDNNTWHTKTRPDCLLIADSRVTDDGGRTYHTTYDQDNQTW